MGTGAGVATATVGSTGAPLDHDVDVRHPESGEHVKLRSKGRLSETIDLDRVTGIKVKAFFSPCKAIILGVEGHAFFPIF